MLLQWTAWVLRGLWFFSLELLLNVFICLALKFNIFFVTSVFFMGFGMDYSFSFSFRWYGFPESILISDFFILSNFKFKAGITTILFYCTDLKMSFLSCPVVESILVLSISSTIFLNSADPDYYEKLTSLSKFWALLRRTHKLAIKLAENLFKILAKLDLDLSSLWTSS